MTDQPQTQDPLVKAREALAAKRAAARLADEDAKAPPPAAEAPEPVVITVAAANAAAAEMLAAEKVKWEKAQEQARLDLAAREAAVKDAERAKVAGGVVRCRVLPTGHGNVATGLYGSDDKQWFDRGDEFECASPIGYAQEAAGRVEVIAKLS